MIFNEKVYDPFSLVFLYSCALISREPFSLQDKTKSPPTLRTAQIKLTRYRAAYSGSVHETDQICCRRTNLQDLPKKTPTSNSTKKPAARCRPPENKHMASSHTFPVYFDQKNVLVRIRIYFRLLQHLLHKRLTVVS